MKYNAPSKFIQKDPWESLRSFTAARIALGRTGAALPLKETLELKLAHADARDAVYSLLDKEKLHKDFASLGQSLVEIKTQAKDRAEYLQRPDLGRFINEIELTKLNALHQNFDIAIILADGLSATAINQHAFAVVEMLLSKLSVYNYKIAPIVLVEQGRVAVGDTIGSALGARLTLVFIGERPGLSSADSMGLYMTLNPRSGLTDESRNCISNIRPEGLVYQLAVDKVLYLVRSAFVLGLSGVGLKEGNALLD